MIKSGRSVGEPPECSEHQDGPITQTYTEAQVSDSNVISVPISSPSQRPFPRWFIQPKARFRITRDDLGGPYSDWSYPRYVVYIVRCDGMPVYIGQTNRSLRTRMREHWLRSTSLGELVLSHGLSSVWSIVVWEYADAYNAKWTERRLIRMYEPQCNWAQTKEQVPSNRHPSLERARLLRMYQVRDHWERRYDRWLRRGQQTKLYDCYLTLPRIDVMDMIAERALAEEERIREIRRKMYSPETIKANLEKIEALFRPAGGSQCPS